MANRETGFENLSGKDAAMLQLVLPSSRATQGRAVLATAAPAPCCSSDKKACAAAPAGPGRCTGTTAGRTIWPRVSQADVHTRRVAPAMNRPEPARMATLASVSRSAKAKRIQSMRPSMPHLEDGAGGEEAGAGQDGVVCGERLHTQRVGTR